MITSISRAMRCPKYTQTRRYSWKPDLAKLSSPSGAARIIENLVLKEKDTDRNVLYRTTCWVATIPLSSLYFPAVLIMELFFKQIPKTAHAFIRRTEAPQCYAAEKDRIVSLVLGILTASVMGLRSPHFVPSFFLTAQQCNHAIYPFGVENILGKQVIRVYTPKTKEELVKLVQRADRSDRQISLIGQGMSQGTQTIPFDRYQMPISMQHLNKIEILEGNIIKVQSGATWEMIQQELNKLGKSAITKQASDPFSIGGSIAINAHGWAHQEGPLSLSVEALEVIDAKGTIIALRKGDELFSCMFGTLGYFGIVFSATLRITDNCFLMESTTEIDIEKFHALYQAEIKNNPHIPLFGGRMALQDLSKVYMNTYVLDDVANANMGSAPIITPNYTKEQPIGKRSQRIALHSLSHATPWFASFMVKRFWQEEKAWMLKGGRITRNAALQPPINALLHLHNSNLNAQWLQEYFILEKHIAPFTRFLNAELKGNGIRLINATIRPVAKDTVSVLPYAEENRYAVVICFNQLKTAKAIEKTRKMIENITKYLTETDGKYYQAYMPFATREQFEACYGKKNVERMRALKMKYDPENRFGNEHTRKYFDTPKAASQMPLENSVDLMTYIAADKELASKAHAFLATIFQQADAEIFMGLLKEILASNTCQSGMDVYAALQARADEAKPKGIFKLLAGLKALKEERGALLRNIEKLSDPHFKRTGGVLEIGLPGRHLHGVAKATGAEGEFAVVNHHESLTDYVQCGIPRPYKTFVPHRGDGSDVLIKEQFPDPISVVIMAAGLHHLRKEHLLRYLKSVYDVLEPGGLFFVREHDATTPDRVKVADIAHHFFNILTGVPPEDEEKEIRNFNSIHYFIKMAEDAGFKLASNSLKREGDPTENFTFKLYKPHSFSDAGEIGWLREQLISFCNQKAETKSYFRPREGTYNTKVEWFNVESERSIAEFYARHPFWLYPHLRDACETANVYFKSFRAAARATSLTEVLKSEYNLMNTTILIATTIQNVSRAIFNAPIALLSLAHPLLQDLNHNDWKKPERWYVDWMKRYSSSLEVTPSYAYPYMQELKQFFAVFRNSYTETRRHMTKAELLTDRQTYRNLATGVAMTADLLFRQAFATPVNMFYGGSDGGDAREIGVIVEMQDCEATSAYQMCALLGPYMRKRISAPGSPYAGLVLPRYQKLTESLSILVDRGARIIEIAGHTSIGVEFLVRRESASSPFPEIPNGRKLYRRKYLGNKDFVIVAYSIPVADLSIVLGTHRELVHRIYDF